MTQEEKQLLLVDLSARLPYGVKIYNHLGQISTFYGIKENFIFVPRCVRYGISYDEVDVESIKPYLRPMDSMTDEEKIEFSEFVEYSYNDFNSESTLCIPLYNINDCTNWLNKHHFDYRYSKDEKDGKWKTMIELGLALPALEGMYN